MIFEKGRGRTKKREWRWSKQCIEVNRKDEGNEILRLHITEKWRRKETHRI